MKIVLDIDSSLEKNASELYDLAKTARAKGQRALAAVEAMEEQLRTVEKKTSKTKVKPRQRKEWYEKFRWFLSSDGFLCVGGRDATSNEILVKKHAEAYDLLFHTEMAGSPFFVIKSEGNAIPESTKKEAAEATIIYSRAAKRGLTTADVYSIQPSQASKEAAAGEYLVKGSFVIRGEREYYKVQPEFTLGLLPDGRVCGGPRPAIAAQAREYVVLKQGDAKPSDISRTVSRRWGVHPDDVLWCLPATTFAAPRSSDWQKKDI